MKFTHFFVDRPIFASVLSILVLIIGGLAYVTLPVAEYPPIAPPVITVSANYPGADAETVAATVATPLEQEINGVENLLYISSNSTSDGNTQITVTFNIGTNLDDAQVLVQNRVSTALPRLPEEVQRLGVNTRKSSPDFLMIVHLTSPNDTLDQLYVSNYIYLSIRDALLRVPEVGDVRVFGEREYSMRLWLDPDKLSAYSMTASDVVAAVQQENVQVSGGALGQQPAPEGTVFQLTVTTQGRLSEVSQFENIVVKSGEDGRLVRLRDIARVELGAYSYSTNSFLNNKTAVAIALFQRPGTNALQGAENVLATMEELAQDFPDDLKYQIAYNPTEFVASSVDEVYKTLAEAVLLVVLVVIVFLQSWRAAIIPVLAIPVSLIGTFAVLAAFGFSLNILSLFGLVLAIGIVVDDAIVVVENIERNIAEGLDPRAAAHRTMDEVGSALIAIALVLSAVFIPTAFVPGITGQFYTQFAVTIATATIISAFNSLTLSPALGALLLKGHDHHGAKRRGNPLMAPFRWGARVFNKGFDKSSNGYARSVGWMGRHKLLFLLIYGGLAYATVHMAQTVPTGFIPAMDRGYGIVVVQLPDGASLNRTDDIVERASNIILETPGVGYAIGISGFSGATFSAQSNAAAIFVPFAPFEERVKEGLTGTKVIGDIQARLGGAIPDAMIFAVAPPSVPGIGSLGGFKMMVEDRSGQGLAALEEATNALVGAAAGNSTVVGVYTTFSSKTPQLYLNIDRVKARMLNVPLQNIFDALATNLGSSYVNDFNLYGRIYRVTAQAEADQRVAEADILDLKVRSTTGALVPLGTLVTVEPTTGPPLVQRYNLFPAIPVQGNTVPGLSSGQGLAAMEQVANEALPQGFGFEWTELALQESQQGDTATYILLLCIVFVFLVLAAQYESWALPLAIILIVPMSVLAALVGVAFRGLDNNILTQVGLIVLVGLAAKNAILIVEFARQLEHEGKSLMEATVEAARLRLRPIVMTALAFILGVVPLMIAAGPGAEMRQALGTAVFSGMLGVTVFGLFLTPVFYIAIRSVVLRLERRRNRKPAHA